MKKIDYIIVVCTIAIFAWLLYYAFFSVVFLYENHDVRRTFSINTNEKMLFEIFQTISIEDFSSLYSSKDADSVRNVKNKMRRGLFFMYPKLIFIGASPRISCASVFPADGLKHLSDSRKTIIPIGDNSFAFSRATLIERDFIVFLMIELLWGICCGLLLFRKKSLITAWQNSRFIFMFIFIINMTNGLIFLYVQPSVWNYFSRNDAKSTEYYRESLLALENSSDRQEAKVYNSESHQVFVSPQNLSEVTFRWIKVSPFEYLYQIRGKAELVLPYNDKSISVTNEGDDFYRVMYWQEKLLWYWGLLPGCILVWCIILWSAQTLLIIFTENRKYLKV